MRTIATTATKNVLAIASRRIFHRFGSLTQEISISASEVPHRGWRYGRWRRLWRRRRQRRRQRRRLRRKRRQQETSWPLPFEKRMHVRRSMVWVLRQVGSIRTARDGFHHLAKQPYYSVRFKATWTPQNKEDVIASISQVVTMNHKIIGKSVRQLAVFLCVKPLVCGIFSLAGEECWSWCHDSSPASDVNFFFFLYFLS